MSGPDEIIHQSLRLKIMATLHVECAGGPTEFTRLRNLLKASDGNLGSHLTTLEKAGYVRIDKDFVGKKPRTRVAITPAGAKAFRGHVAYLREVLEGA
jgi:DNA-binding MarR family transcriptional regulator